MKEKRFSFDRKAIFQDNTAGTREIHIMQIIRTLEEAYNFKRPPYLATILSGIPEAPETGRRYDLSTKTSWTIGSGVQDDIQLAPEVAEPHHAKMEQRGKDWYLIAAEHEVYCNQMLIHHWIKDGDVLTIGQSLFKFFSGVGPNAIYDEVLYERGIIDPLTEVYDRGFFDQSFTREYKRCKRLKQPLSLLMIDIDNFKGINTKYGHQGGDEILRQVTSLLVKARVREDEIFARYGGEEFMLILPNAKPKQALQIAEQIRELVESSTIVFQKREIKITASIGSATLSYKKMEIGLEEKELIKKANVNVLQAKDKGRNCVVG